MCMKCPRRNGNIRNWTSHTVMMMLIMCEWMNFIISRLDNDCHNLYICACSFNSHFQHEPGSSSCLRDSLSSPFWKDNLLNEWHRFLQVGCPSQYPAVRIEALKAA